MAKGRILSKRISTSRKVAALKTDSARMFFDWMNSHTDDFGRIDGDPWTLKHLVVPTLGHHDANTVADLVADLESVGLIETWSVNKTIVIQIIKFDEHQSGLHKRTKSMLPDKPKKVPGSSGKSRGIPGDEKAAEKRKEIGVSYLESIQSRIKEINGES